MRTVSTELESLLLTAPVILLVEDVLTKEYLIRIWQPDDKYFSILVAYGRESVRALLMILGLQALEMYLALSIVILERAIVIGGPKYCLMKQSLSYRYLK